MGNCLFSFHWLYSARHTTSHIVGTVCCSSETILWINQLLRKQCWDGVCTMRPLVSALSSWFYAVGAMWSSLSRPRTLQQMTRQATDWPLFCLFFAGDFNILHAASNLSDLQDTYSYIGTCLIHFSLILSLLNWNSKWWEWPQTDLSFFS